MDLIALAIVVSLTWVWLPAAGVSSAAAAEPVRVLIMGDSVTHGIAGDWTWRYRLWKHLDATAAMPVDFVGPHDDLYDTLSLTRGNHDYVDPGFDADHAAGFGMSLAYPETSVSKLVTDHRPGVVVAMLGIIDLITYRRTPESIVGSPVELSRQPGSLTQLVRDARSVDPGVSVVLAEIPQWWISEASEVNALMHVAAAVLDAPGARVLVAETADGYTSGSSTHDGSHPDAMGEVQLAAAVADTLAKVGLGAPAQRPLPVPPLGPRLPPQLTGTLSGARVVLSWRPSPGAETSQVQAWSSARSRWEVVEDRVAGTTWSMPVAPGDRVRLRVLPRKGWRLAQPDAASNVVSVRVPRSPGRARPRVAAEAGGALVRWRPAARAASYAVSLKVGKRRGWQLVASDRERRRLVLSGLRPGKHYVVRVRAVNSGGVGPWARVRFVAR